MTVLWGIGFLNPWLLLGLAALPILWILLRAIPPAARRQAFPAITLLLGLRDEESLADRTPWWLLLLRMAAVAAAIVGLAAPVLNPSEAQRGSGPLLLVLDASWAGATDWAQRQEQMETLLQDASRNERPVAVLRLSAPEPLQFEPARTMAQQVAGLVPEPWQPSGDMLRSARDMITASNTGFDTIWFSDGLSYGGPEKDALRAALAEKGAIEVFEPTRPVLGLLPARYEEGAIALRALRQNAATDLVVGLQAHGLDPAGQPQILATTTMQFDAGETEAGVQLSLPAELRARVTRFELTSSETGGPVGARSAGAVALSDDRLRRREVALVSPQAGNEGLALLSPLHYLREALDPTADLIEGGLSDLLPANPDVVVLADVAQLPPDQSEALEEWVEKGGLLLRFAGPRLAASDTARDREVPLMPVRLRIGGRSIGGAMSWGEPKALAPFKERSPFYGLAIPDEVTVSSQVMAQPDPSLADRVIAELADGTPLVTRKPLGQGQVVLFHVTANAEWSALPLSGLFVEMLERLAVSSAVATPEAEDLAGTRWQAVNVLDGFGRLSDAGALPGVDGGALVSAPTGPALRPGLYLSETRSFARNVLSDGAELTPAVWPASIPVRGFEASAERPLGGAFLSTALILLALDIIAALWVSGLWAGLRRGAAGPLVLATALLSAPLLLAPETVWAQDGAGTAQSAEEIAAQIRLAHVLTGDDAVDDLADQGLRGLSHVLTRRTSIEPAAPVGVDLERDELAFYPLLYWPVTASQPLPSSEAYRRLNDYLRNGGMILFDTRDSDLTGNGATSPAARRLQQLALPMDIPPLEPVPRDHVLTRAFYLLQDFPGRHPRGAVWVEAASAPGQEVEGLPFRNLNDGVSPVVIGGNDWASAWAVDRSNQPLYPIGRGFAGERQRELARRFGINLVMHVLTGNYKSDQVHVPALLDRLGQ